MVKDAGAEANAEYPMLVTLEGIVMDSRDVHPSNANQSILIIPIDIITLFKVSEENAFSALFVTV